MMPPRVTALVSFLPSTDDDDDDDDDLLIDSFYPNPRSSFLFLVDPSDPFDSPPRRRFSLFSIDSGYFSVMGKDSPIPNPFDRKHSKQDLRLPLVPINGTIHPKEDSPKREGVIRNFLKKRKRSHSSFLPDLEPSTLPLSHRVPPDDAVTQVHQSPPFLRPQRPAPRDPSIDAFEKDDRFIVRGGMKHHPYPRVDAPYMLAYDRTILDNDKYSEILLRRLNPNHSPSFLDFSHTSPKTILDLGCGAGGWAVEAAEFWPSSQVIGFDLLDPTRLRDGLEAPSNVQWKQGNFVKYKLPFPKNMFDLVRMANLSLCVPHERWEHVLLEARRVLARGGRLELIDDYLYFPYAKHPPQPSEDSHGIPCDARPSSSSFDDDDDDDDDGADDHTIAARPHNTNDDQDDDDDDFVSTKSRFSSLEADANDNVLPVSAYDPVAQWDRNVENSKCLEKLFEDMLLRKFSVHPRPNKFLDNVLDKAFRRHNQRRLHEFNLYLAPPSSQDSDDSSVGSSDSHGSGSLKKAGKDFAKWVTHVDWDHNKKQRSKGDRSSDDSLSGLSTVPDMISAKAAGRLGINSSLTNPTHSHPNQSPGLILWPATFIPISPFELEMHACKHLHSLIGCKAALSEFLQDIAREQNLPFDQQMVDDFIWDYESFRRKRFNWPSECPDSYPDLGSPFATAPQSNTYRNSLEHPAPARPSTGCGNMSPPPDPLHPREKLDFVRSIRVYCATKHDEESHVP